MTDISGDSSSISDNGESGRWILGAVRERCYQRGGGDLGPVL